jgi:hypothetical protein
MGEDKVVQTTVRLKESVIRAAKVYAAQHDLGGFQGAVERALELLLKKGGR